LFMSPSSHTQSPISASISLTPWCLTIISVIANHGRVAANHHISISTPKKFRKEKKIASSSRGSHDGFASQSSFSPHARASAAQCVCLLLPARSASPHGPTSHHAHVCLPPSARSSSFPSAFSFCPPPHRALCDRLLRTGAAATSSRPRPLPTAAPIERVELVCAIPASPPSPWLLPRSPLRNPPLDWRRRRPRTAPDAVRAEGVPPRDPSADICEGGDLDFIGRPSAHRPSTLSPPIPNRKRGHFPRYVFNRAFSSHMLGLTTGSNRLRRRRRRPSTS
jgi:hypothetical protein